MVNSKLVPPTLRRRVRIYRVVPGVVGLVFAGWSGWACVAPPEVAVSATQAVVVEAIEPAAFVPRLSLLGVVRPALQVALVTGADGAVGYPPRFGTSLLSGTRVDAGTLIAEIESPTVAAALSEARILERAAATEADRYRKAFAEGALSAANLAGILAEAEVARHRLAAAQVRRGELEVRSPIAGVLVVEQAIPARTIVTRGTVLATVITETDLLVEAWVHAEDASRLEAGLPVALRLGTGAERGRGVVRALVPSVDRGGFLQVVVAVESGAFAIGQGVELEVELAPSAAALTVPQEVLVGLDSSPAVYVVERRHGAIDLLARLRTVKTGARGAGRVEVLEGLRAGDRVVVSGIELLTDGASVVEAVDAGASAGGA